MAISAAYKRVPHGCNILLTFARPLLLLIWDNCSDQVALSRMCLVLLSQFFCFDVLSSLAAIPSQFEIRHFPPFLPTLDVAPCSFGTQHSHSRVEAARTALGHAEERNDRQQV